LELWQRKKGWSVLEKLRSGAKRNEAILSFSAKVGTKLKKEKQKFSLFPGLPYLGLSNLL